ncbi:hypothetical protein AB4455_25590 [Vibrio sp. 10N.261.46.E12]|uniref:hypothetical protein n=1 Tax=unclassified Vibrio TaxID=2614977 RepID=UPI0012FFEBE7|nr:MULTISPECIES: hypothetical protein [unclassified Vibrio]
MLTTTICSGGFSCDYDENYFTHFMLLPIELTLVQNYRAACIKSGIETKVG